MILALSSIAKKRIPTWKPMVFILPKQQFIHEGILFVYHEQELDTSFKISYGIWYILFF